MIREIDYERSTTAPTTPLNPPHVRIELPPSLSGAFLLIGSFAVFALAWSHIFSGNEAQAVAWAFVVAGVIAALRKWA